MDIIAAVDRFINHRMYHYALLINGGWGSGKTFFVKENLIPHIKESKYSVTYLSLYGIRTTDEISQMLYIQAIKDRAPAIAQKAIDSKVGQITTKLASALFKGGMNFIGAGDTGIEKIVQVFTGFDNSVIIFDDLERCDCSINEVLGYINNFVEHSEASVILVANEEEIGKWQLDRNPELQTLIAMDSRIKVKLPPTIADYIGENKKQETRKETTFTPDDVEYRRKAIFHSNEVYKAIKEKVIGLTINYEPDLRSIFSALIEKKKPEGKLRELLTKDLDWFVFIAEKDEHKNLRTFQYFLEKITIIFETIRNEYPTLHQVLVRYTYRSSVRYMKGEKMPVWDGDYGNQEFGDDKLLIVDSELGFRFIDDLIVSNRLDSVYTNEVLGRFARMAEKKGQLSNDPYRQIKGWWKAEDVQLEEWLNSIEKNIRDGKYSTELYTELIRYIADIKAHHVMEEKCDLIFQAMKTYIKTEESSEIEALDREHFMLNEDTEKIFRPICEEISQLIKEVKTETEKQKYEEAVKDPLHWATNLVTVIKNKGNIESYSFVYWLDPKLIVGRINKSNNSELYQFRNALQAVYNKNVYYECLNDDYEHLKELYDDVEKLDTSAWGEVKKAYKVWIVNDINRYLERIEPVEETE